MNTRDEEAVKRFRNYADSVIGWNSEYGAHISDGADSCSGDDKEEEEK